MADKEPKRTPAGTDLEWLRKGSRTLLEEMNDTAKAMHKVVKAEEQLAKTTAAVSKSAKGALASFDQLDVLVQKKATASGSSEELTNAEKFPGMDKGRGGQPGAQHTPELSLDAAGFTDDLDGIGGAFSQLTQGMDQMWREKLESITASWVAAQALITGNIGQLIPALTTLISEGWEETVRPILEDASLLLETFWNEQIVPNFNSLMTYLAQLIAQAPPILKNFITPVTDAFTTVLLPGATLTVGAVGDMTKAMGETIAGVAAGIMTTFSGVIDFLTGTFTGDWSRAWQGVQEIFSGQWNAMQAFAKGTANAIIALINAMIKAATDGINFLIRQMNRIHFDVPDWVPYIGGKSFGVSIDPIEPYQIPMLATGAVIPPGAEFLAVLGDQKHGRNLEAPEGLIRQIVREESGQGQLRLNVSARGSTGELVRWLRFELEQEENRQGQSLIKGGGSVALY